MMIVDSRVHTRLFITIAVCLMPLAAVVSPAAAQTGASGKWEIELHVGGMVPTDSKNGTVSLPGPAEVFTTAGIYGPPAPPVLVVASSKRVSSWYFGDGAILFNQTATAVAANPVAMTAPFPGRIVTLDPVLGRSLGEVRRGGNAGVRVGRTLTPRLSVELSVDYSLARVQMTQANQDAIDATGASFIGAFSGLIGSNPGRVLRSITSTAALEGGRAHQLFTSGALIVNLRTSGRLTPYATVGASLISIHGKLPGAVLTGNYQFSNLAGALFNETDNVAVRDRRSTHSFGGILGGGLKYHLSPRWGIRFDARVSLSSNTSRTVLDAMPNVALGQLPAGRNTLNSDPTIQFGNSPNPVTALAVTSVAPSSLSGPTVTGLRTWSGSGLPAHSTFTAGVFWRFW